MPRPSTIGPVFESRSAARTLHELHCAAAALAAEPAREAALALALSRIGNEVTSAYEVAFSEALAVADSAA